jgi:hypothetical protein
MKKERRVGGGEGKMPLFGVRIVFVLFGDEMARE